VNYFIPLDQQQHGYNEALCCKVKRRERALEFYRHTHTHTHTHKLTLRLISGEALQASNRDHGLLIFAVNCFGRKGRVGMYRLGEREGKKKKKKKKKKEKKKARRKQRRKLMKV